MGNYFFYFVGETINFQVIALGTFKKKEIKIENDDRQIH